VRVSAISYRHGVCRGRLFADGETVVQDVDCIRESYPGFETALEEFVNPKRMLSRLGSLVHFRPRCARKSDRDERRLIREEPCYRVHRVVAIDGPARVGKSSVLSAGTPSRFAYVNSEQCIVRSRGMFSRTGLIRMIAMDRGVSKRRRLIARSKTIIAHLNKRSDPSAFA